MTDVTVPAQPGPFRYAAGKVALVIIDMQRDFLLPVDHPVEAYAVRVTEVSGGGSLVFSGDTGPCEALVELARGEDGTGVDLLLVEAAFLAGPDLPSGLHLTGAQAAAAGEAAGVGAVVLTHVPPWHEPERVLAEARPHFSGDTSLAVTGAVRRIGPDGPGPAAPPTLRHDLPR